MACLASRISAADITRLNNFALLSLRMCSNKFLQQNAIKHSICMTASPVNLALGLHHCKNEQRHSNVANHNMLPKPFNLFSKFSSLSESKERETPDEMIHSPRVTATLLASPSHRKALATFLECNMYDVRCLIDNHPFLAHMAYDLFESKVNLMLSYGLTVSFVRNHPRIVYQTSIVELERRLKAVKDNGLFNTNFLPMEKLPHMLECKSRFFNKGLKNRLDQRAALEGCRDQLHYLQMRLGCTEMKAKHMLNSYPLERNTSNTKVKTLLDFFLIEINMSPDFVIEYRKLLVFSIHRLRSRWVMMQKAKIDSEPMMVHVWSISQKDYLEEYAEYLKPESDSTEKSD